MKNKKIFFLADSKSVHTAKWVDYFVKEGYKVFVATFANDNCTQCTNIYYLSNKRIKKGSRNFHYLLSISKLSQILKDIQPDVVNAHYSYSMGLIAYLALYKSRVRSSFSIVCHGSDVLAPPMPFLINKINSYLLKKCHKIFVVSDQIKDVLEDYGVLSRKIFVGQYGLELTKKGIVKKDIDILSNRAYISNSRIDFLLECMNQLDCKNLNIVFVLPHIATDEFKDLCKKFPDISFYKEISYSRMMDFMYRTKIYISATKSDGTSLSLLESMNSKAIPVVSNIISNRSWILDGINGFLFNNGKDFTEKMQKALTCESKYMNKINMKLLEEKANYNRQMKKIENFLLEDV